MTPRAFCLTYLAGLFGGWGILLSVLGAPAEFTIISFLASAASAAVAFCF